MSLGPIMLDVRGTELAADELELLRHPLVGGVILFARNFAEPKQLQELTRSIHAVREPHLLIAVDHEGGRVQRFHQGFTALPAAACYGRCFDKDENLALTLCEQAGWLLASELMAVGVDFSFTPVLDLDYGVSSVIGDRAYHRNIDNVSLLGGKMMQGMQRAGMAAVGKHFPGHGYVKADSHTEVPRDERRFEDIIMEDLVPFERLIQAGLSAIMPAHVIYPAVDDRPAGFSSIWLQQILRDRLRFSGTIFSDDISMSGAEVAGNYVERSLAALQSGCDMVLICNNQPAAVSVLDELQIEIDPVLQVRLMRMHSKEAVMDLQTLQQNDEWSHIVQSLVALDATPELGLGDDQITS